jgi:hypothetical protein
MSSLTPVFMGALRSRRDKQAKQIISSFRGLFERGTVLDYGCGQGAFVQELTAAGLKAIGADLSLEGCDGNIPQDRFIPLPGEWSIPQTDAKTVCLLDVLEHSQNPLAFLEALQARFQYIVIKVPMLRGPIGLGSQTLTALGNTSLMQRLLLTEDISPHCSFFTRRGLIALAARSGLLLEQSIRIPDVGPELPNRLRSSAGDVEAGFVRSVLVIVGGVLQLIAPLWSDTEVFIFRRQA